MKVAKRKRRFRGYDGTGTTTFTMRDVVPGVLEKIRSESTSPLHFLRAFWPQVIGPQFASMTELKAFDDGVLHITVNSASLLSLLSQYEKGRLLRELKSHFPNVVIRDLYFRRG